MINPVTRKSTILHILAISVFAGCSGGIEPKKPIALDQVPADIMKIAKEKYPDLNFYASYTEVEQGQPVYELMGKTQTGKIMEVEVTKDGKILNP